VNHKKECWGKTLEEGEGKDGKVCCQPTKIEQTLVGKGKSTVTGLLSLLKNKKGEKGRGTS